MQFADRYAFARELVQNAIDAGATRIVTRVDHSADALVISFEDDGSGMSLEIIEGSLLTLFASTKERSPEAIGRYGVGFKSVLAVDPERVEVETHHATGSFRVTLLRDHTFEIVEASPRGSRGTRVSLVLRPEAEHEPAVIRALFRWCRHVKCPITLVDGSGATHLVNLPLELSGPLVLSSITDAGTVLVAPLTSEPVLHDPEGSFIGFYAHGLTLLEATTREPARTGLRIKVESRDLGCTISRDDVRRDAAFDRVMRIVDDLAEQLPRRLEDHLMEEAALASSRGTMSAAHRDALIAGSRLLPPSRLPLPLAVPEDDASWKTLEEARSLRDVTATSRRDALADHAASLGLPVLLDDASTTLLATLGLTVGRVDARVTALAEQAVPPRLAVMLPLVARHMSAALGRPVELVVVEHVGGRRPPRDAASFARATPAPRRWLLPETSEQDTRSVVLIVSGPATELLSAATRPVPASHLFARMILLWLGVDVDADANARLVGAAAEIRP